MEEKFGDEESWGGNHARHLRWFRVMQAKRGDMRPIVLHMLEESPMHGYEIIRRLEEKSHGFWRPSPGSIYPTLQLLEDEDLIMSREKNGKKIYELTKAGRKEASKLPESAPWEKGSEEFARKMELWSHAVGPLKTLRRIAREGSEQDIEKLKKLLDEFKAKLEQIAPK